MTAPEYKPSPPPGQPLADAVTGAFSRALFEVRAREEVERATRSGSDCALCLFDVDHFKNVNDAFGHARGDDVLRVVAQRVGDMLRSPDVLFRYGGDEFVLLLPGADRARASQVGQRVVDGLAKALFAGDPPLRVSISMGVAAFPTDATDTIGLVAVADRRCYLAKRQGRARVVADDAVTATSLAPSRLLERDAPLTAAREFLARLKTEGRGTLRIGGERGAGYTSFLNEFARIAGLRDFEVIRVGDRVPGDAVPATLVGAQPSGNSAGLLIFADGEAAWSAAARLASEHLAAVPPAGEHPLLGLVLAAPGPAIRPAEGVPPLLAVIQLQPWSSAAIRVWLRTKLRGEPTTALVDLIAARSRGLPARAERAVNRLVAAQGLEQATGGGWMLARHAGGHVPVQRAIPEPPTELVGRGSEIDEIGRLLAAGRMVTLIGPGGIGKTRLALAVAAASEDLYDAGAVFVPLADAGIAARVESAVAQALGVTEAADRTLLDSIAGHLASRELLLVLDNFEQVLPAAASVAAWLGAAPGLTVLVTSRQRLQLPAGHVYEVPPLTLPELATLSGEPDAAAAAVERSSALLLFSMRAQRVDYDFVLAGENLATAAQLCHRLDGLPLAIELAAGRVDVLAPAELLARIGERLDMLVDGPQDVPARQRTLRAAIGWSFELLDQADQQLFTALGTFAGGCRLEAVEAVWPMRDLAARLDGLVERSLLHTESDPDGQTRYLMLETIRAFAAEKAAGCAVGIRHATYYATFAEQASPELIGPGQTWWLDLIALEIHNIRAALVGCLDHDEVATAGRIVGGIWRFWWTRGYYTEGREWIDRVLAADPDLPAVRRAELLYAAAGMTEEQGDVRGAQRLAEQSLACAESVDARGAMTMALRMLGRIHGLVGEFEQAKAFHQQSLALARAQSDEAGVAGALGDLGDVAIRLGDFDEARELVSESLAHFRAVGHTLAVLACLASLGEVLMFQGDVVAARANFEEALGLCRSLGDVRAEGWLLHHLGALAIDAGDRAGATGLLTAALRLRHRVGEHQSVADSLEALAGLTIDTCPAAAARLFGAAEAIRDEYGLPRAPVWQGQWMARTDRLRAEMGQPMCTTAWAAGRAADLDDSVREALALGAPAGSAAD